MQAATKFNQLTRELITMLERKSRRDDEIANLDRLKKRISLLKSTVGDTALINVAAPFFIEYAEKILDEDITRREAFFLNIDIRGECTRRGGVITQQDEFLLTLTNSMRMYYTTSDEGHRALIYAKIRDMLTSCIEYEIATSGQ